MTVTFDPDSWDTQAATVTSASDSAYQSLYAAVNATPFHYASNSPVDFGIIAGVDKRNQDLGRVLAQLARMAARDSQNMIDTATDYRETEAANTDASSQIISMVGGPGQLIMRAD